ncbi:MAG: efflux RND transporter periplasmic adaptor subunit [Planctomycetota bacterium]|nr:efflux RND transporter periplasmic adaptor subunit [Planctomycetota bacterium]
MSKRFWLLPVVAAALLAALVYSQQRSVPLKVSGFVEADEIRVGSRVGGRVARVLVEEGDSVVAGQALVVLDPFQLEELLAQAQGQLAQTEADAARLEAGFRPEEIAQAEARVAQLTAARDKLADGAEEIAAAQASQQLAQAELELAKQKYERTERFFGQKSASQQDMDMATTEVRVARATVQVRTEELGRLERLRPKDLAEAEARREEAAQEAALRRLGYRQEDRTRAAAAVSTAKASVEAIRKQIAELKIHAPADGVVESIDLRPGDLVGAGTPAASIVEAGRLWIRAYVPENRLSLETGHPVRVTVDSLPGQSLRGKVTFVARQAEFTPGNVQTPEERSKQVFRIKVTLENPPAHLRPGMSGDVWLDTEEGR